MIRIALVGRSEGDWTTYRQEQWMAEVRRDPSITRCPRVHFDISETEYKTLVETWSAKNHGSSRQAALDRLAQAHAVEVAPP